MKELFGVELYVWQREVIEDIGGEVRPEAAYVQVARKNGKTLLAAALILSEIILLPERHVYGISDSERNLNSVLVRELRTLVSSSPAARAALHVSRAGIENPANGSFFEVRPGRFEATQGINPHLVVADEVHLAKAEVWHGMQMAGTARDDPMLLGITTPGYDLTGLAHGLYEAAKAGDPTLYSKIYEADAAADIDDEAAWAQANPCFGRPGFVEKLRVHRERLPEHEFRRFHMGQWTATDQAWLPYGAWKACEAAGRPVPPPGTRVWLGFDGSYSGDSTALVGVSEDLHVFVVGCWENPGRAGWRVPRKQVLEVVAEAFDTWQVVEMLCDPPYWGAEIAEWAATYPGRVTEFPTFSRARMAPACTTFYTAVMEQTVSHDGDPRLARHVSNCVVKSSPLGDYVTKADKDSPAKIDLAVAAIIAYSAAAGDKRPARAPVFVL
jgi:phage terminase large subunit-like protein